MSFLKTFALSSLLIFALCAGLVLSVDPYEKYGFNPFGFETKAVMFGREVKFRMLDNTSEKYEAFILGSSSAHRYRTKDMQEITGLKTFNYSVQHSSPEDYLAITRHILKKQKPKLIFIQMGFENLNKHFKTDPRLYNSPLRDFLKAQKNNYFEPEIANTYLTLDALWDSLRVIGVNSFGKARHIYLEHGDYPKEEPRVGKVKLSQNTYAKYEVGEENIKTLEQIKWLAKAHGVRLVIATAPLSYEHYAGIKEQGLTHALEQYKKSLQSIFPEVYDFTYEGIKSFSTIEYFRDSSHPNPKLSRLVLESIFSGGKAKLGRNLSSKEI